MKYGSPQGPVARLREHGNLALGFRMAEFFFLPRVAGSFKYSSKDYAP